MDKVAIFLDKYGRWLAAAGIGLVVILALVFQPDRQSAAEAYVDVKGAVVRPGLYRVGPGMRVYDAVMLAGGLAEGADRDRVNFSQRLADQMVVYVPRAGEEVPPAWQSPVGTSSPAGATGPRININTADASQLQEISGIGAKRAKDIIAYREANGPFQSVDQLTEVPGIGAKTLENMRPQITVGP